MVDLLIDETLMWERIKKANKQMPVYMNDYARKTVSKGLNLALTQADPCLDNKVANHTDQVPKPDPQPKLRVLNGCSPMASKLQKRQTFRH